MKTNPKAAVRFLAALFKHAAAPVFITSLANDRSATHRLPPRQVVTRNSKLVENFVASWDRTERALYFCVATLKPGILRRTKDNLGELVCLHCDIDFKDVEASPKEIERAIAASTLLPTPSLVVSSGNGLHLYWVLKPALVATPDNVARVEACLRRIAFLLAGDVAVCECARLMRLPGSHNSKRGAWSGVRVIMQSGHAYRLHKLEAGFARASQLLRRRQTKDPGPDRNPWTALGEAQSFAPPIDIEERLAEMQFHGPDLFSVHNTQLSVTAALLTRGFPVEDVVERVLIATAKAVGSEGRGWDWEKEKCDLRHMCRKWLEKHPQVVFVED